MASEDEECSASRHTQGEPPHVARTPRDKGGKLLADAQRVAKATSKERPGRVPPKGRDDWDITIGQLQAQLILIEDVLYEIYEGMCELHSFWRKIFGAPSSVIAVLVALHAEGCSVVISLEVGLPIIRTEAYDAAHNNEVLARDLDLVEERRDNALIRMADCQKQLAKSFNQKVQWREFTMGDLVLRKVIENTKDPTNGKLGPNWEGPYNIVKLASRGSYYLEDAKGKELPRDKSRHPQGFGILRMLEVMERSTQPNNQHEPNTGLNLKATELLGTEASNYRAFENGWGGMEAPANSTQI
ncbi:hypothetical protein Acr_10g0008720 [Actinidia rufa]|uniref:Uncharacterized protein n=1 Tax=Actinidia rufa TaxID=165716 RepID=A0A7J0FC67_9ERIC|nr:hypothetical protein Acr_10g0008720 [Actinidia rufa]